VPRSSEKPHLNISAGFKAVLFLGLFVVIAIPASAYARSQKAKFSRTPEVVEPKNSQTMSLLEGRANTNTTPSKTPRLAIVDGSALSSEGDGGESFVDVGKSGTGQISVYIVRKGDTLPAIAKMFGVSTNTIVWANDLKGSKIVEGQELVILPISGVRHTVKKGDTLKSIATKYKADMNDVLAYNDITVDTKLVPGSIIIVPDGEISASSSSSTSSSGTKNPSISNVPSYAGYYMRPISGGRKTQGIHGHNGVDLASSMGTPIMAAAKGTVIVSKTGGYNGGYGTYVVISHPNGTQTLYGHLSSNNVGVGQSVEQGQVIGGMGNSGKSTGVHLHFEVRGAKNPF
jgi:LysM repeat protein